MDAVTLVLLLSILLQLAAVGIALRQVLEWPKLRWAWGMVTAAFALMTLGRILILGSHLEQGPGAGVVLEVEIIGLFISLFLVVGVAQLGPVFTQITRSEAQLQESQRAMSALMKNLPGMAYRCLNDPHWTMEFVSEGCVALTGYRPEELIGNRVISYAELIVPEHRQQVLENVQRAIAADEPFQLVYRIRTAQGEEKWVWEKGSAVRDAQGKVIALEGFIADITERCQAEELLRKTQDELEKLVAQRTAELDRTNRDLMQFVYTVSHDLQEPLRMMSTYLQTLRGSLKDRLQPTERSLLDLSAEACQRLQRMIQDLLAYSRAGTRGIYFEPVDANQVVQEAIQNLQAAIDQTGAQITLDPLPEVTADATLLLELFQNLLSNAIKFHAKDRSPKVRIFCQQQDDEWLFGVQDNGIGIDPDAIERIFLIFERLHPEEEYPGTGIGLAICKRIVERHGGRIWCQSKPGEGSTFYFTLPKRMPDTARQRENVGF
ncbi:MAG: ATP-binding protein [Thermoguttaceae bacterium]|nr:ATP-binding protein [Thermoguttaceae bacterium]MDW8037991.1 ATP-binding protein [Thermoguttaceae bacterium]